MLNAVGRFIYTKYICTMNTLCWILWEDLLTQNTGEYFMLHTVGRFIYTKYYEYNYVEYCGKICLQQILGNTLCWILWKGLFTQNTGEYFMLNSVGRFIYTKYWSILHVEHCGKIYLHKITRNTLCWTPWKDLFSQNTGEYFMLNTVGRFLESNEMYNCWSTFDVRF